MLMVAGAHTAVTIVAVSLPFCTSNTNLTCSSNTRETAPAMHLVYMATATSAFLTLPAE